MTEPTEEQLEGYLESLSQNGMFSIDSIEGFIPIFTVVGLIFIAVFYAVMFFRKKAEEKKLNAELSDYYDEYMNGEYDMDFQDFVFCRKHKIRIRENKKVDDIDGEDERINEIEISDETL